MNLTQITANSSIFRTLQQDSALDFFRRDRADQVLEFASRLDELVFPFNQFRMVNVDEDIIPAQTVLFCKEMKRQGITIPKLRLEKHNRICRRWSKLTIHTPG